MLNDEVSLLLLLHYFGQCLLDLFDPASIHFFEWLKIYLSLFHTSLESISNITWTLLIYNYSHSHKKDLKISAICKLGTLFEISLMN